MTTKRIGFIGLGLIARLIAKAIRQYYPDYELLAFDKNKETLALAVQEENESTLPALPSTIIFKTALISFYAHRSLIIPLI